jgi:hypothetical protein
MAYVGSCKGMSAHCKEHYGRRREVIGALSARCLGVSYKAEMNHPQSMPEAAIRSRFRGRTIATSAPLMARQGGDDLGQCHFFRARKQRRVHGKIQRIAAECPGRREHGWKVQFLEFRPELVNKIDR